MSHMFDFLEKKQDFLLDHDGQVIYYPNLIENSKQVYEELFQSIEWEEKEITLYGKTHKVPRLSAWYGDQGSDYTYSGVKMKVNTWSELLLQLKQTVETHANCQFNGVLCNLYRNGSDYAAWHSDDEPELGKNPVIASLSFGETRSFHLRHKTNKGIETYKFNLEDGSLILMKGALQHHWKHQLAKTAKKVEPRINLTFRKII
jgi:alkylated DNA repair dioxygenase AlkB